MEALSSRDYRNSIGASFDRAAEGERVFIRRKNNLYALECIDNANSEFSTRLNQRIETIAKSLLNSWQEIQKIESGEISGKLALDFIDEL